VAAVLLTVREVASSFILIRHRERLRGTFAIRDSGVFGARLSIDIVDLDGERQVSGTYSCRGARPVPCIGARARLTNVTITPHATNDDPRDVPGSNFDGDLLFDAEALRCHMTGATPLYPRLLTSLTGTYACIDRNGMTVQEGRFVLASARCS